MRLANKKTIKIELGSDEWVEVKEKLSYAELEPVISAISQDPEKESFKQILPLVEKAVVGWHLLDDDGKEVEFKKELIKELDFETITEINTKITELYLPVKKN